MDSEILYLDGTKNKAVEKAIKKYGKVYYAKDINEAVELIADRKFDYYFLDADTPYVRELLVHLDHDPYFVPPKAFVLLTDNEVEDCGAWKVDTFITRRRIKEDLPFVFSHLVGEPPDNSGVLTLVIENSDRDTGFHSEGQASADSGDGAEYDNFNLLRKKRRSFNHHTGFADKTGSLKSFIDLKNTGRSKGRNVSSTELTVPRLRIRLVAVGMLAVTIMVLVYSLVPTGSGNAKKSSVKKDGEKASAIDVGKTQDSKDKQSVDFVYTVEQAGGRQRTDVMLQPAGENADGNAVDSGSPSEVKTTEAVLSPSNTYADTPTATPTTPQTNNPPTVSLSGPVQVYAKQVATYTASASDLDGDSISYSWGSSSKTVSWSTPGQYTVSVAVTDAKGASGSASISVRVI